MGVISSSISRKTGRRLPAFFMAAVLLLSGLYLGTGEVQAAVTFDKNADNTGTGTSIMCDPTEPLSEDDSWIGSFVYFGHYDKDYEGNVTGSIPVKYRVLQKSTTAYNTDEQTSAGRKTMFLDCDWVLFKSIFDDSVNAWSVSDLWITLNGDGFLQNMKYFAEAEKKAVAESTISTDYEPLDKDSIFVLGIKEVIKKEYGYLNVTNDNAKTRIKKDVRKNTKYAVPSIDTGSGRYWWLRTAASEKRVRVVSEVGNANNYIAPYTEIYSGTYPMCVSPAMNLDLSKILFSTCIQGIKGEVNAEYKLTVLDGAITAGLGTGTVFQKGNTITIPYSLSGTNAANVNRLSVVITDKPWNSTTGWSDGTTIKQYTKLDTGSAKPSASGVGSFAIDTAKVKGTWGSGYHVYLLAEDIAEDDFATKSTDFASAPVEITNAPVIMVDEVTVDSNKADLLVGETKQLKATVTPDNATDRSVTWASSNASVATVSNKGLVTAKGEGTAVITVKTNDGSGESATCTVTVTDPFIPKMELNDSKLVVRAGAKKASKSIKAILENDTIKSVSISKDIAKVSFEGDTIVVMPGKKAGKADITVTSASGIQRIIKLEIQKAKVITKTLTLKPKKTKITLNGIGATSDYQAIASPDYYSTGEKVKVTSNKKSVVTVNNLDPYTGKFTLTAVGKGTAKITVSAGKKKATINVTVKAPVHVKNVSLNKKSANLKVKQTLNLKATLSPKNVDKDKTGVTWTSSDPSVVKITKKNKLNCTVKAVSPGEAKIRVTTKDGGFYKECNIKVKAK